jgi:hypothetical protein
LGATTIVRIGGDLIIASGYVPGIVIYLLLLFAFAIYVRRITDAIRR